MTSDKKLWAHIDRWIKPTSSEEIARSRAVYFADLPMHHHQESSNTLQLSNHDLSLRSNPLQKEQHDLSFWNERSQSVLHKATVARL
eukprot:CAMPEP_0114549688 /NCGR_PEP_ID=MMETSP0114-20121206/5659_1 /TAXON_ID=31324 /ORGANISM="Goniomonas sp, Strain m" /LENGTH=86 /DNA_ID=CAMNT_0001734383 /DNA_START=72 /DNA_END=332 /DNA_ORIENTATION=+